MAMCGEQAREREKKIGKNSCGLNYKGSARANNKMREINELKQNTCIRANSITSFSI
jgi:hypothetical protein